MSEFTRRLRFNSVMGGVMGALALTNAYHYGANGEAHHLLGVVVGAIFSGLCIFDAGKLVEMRDAERRREESHKWGEWLHRRQMEQMGEEAES